ncbi:MAG TPA: Mut7-C RNAse domain-containing protein, partial [Longimicrobium sp.]|nr:Mut7-C RNAse domain-containing protein [Longimicrobium sp.]
PLAEVAKEAVLDRLPPRVRESRDRFKSCPGCGGLFWEGTHHQHMRRFIDELLKAERPAGRAPATDDVAPVDTGRDEGP